MKIVYKEGSRSRFEDMDSEAQEAVRRAISMVKGKTGFRTDYEVWRDCTLEVTFGHNIYTTTIYIVPDRAKNAGTKMNGYAIYINGVFVGNHDIKIVELI